MKKWSLFLFLLTSAISFSQETSKLKLYSFEQVEALQKENPKPVMVFIYADWCGYCHKMRDATLTDSKVIDLLNESFYLVLLNGEYRKDITFLGETYSFKPYKNSGTHELALKLVTKRKRMAYPTTVILNSELKVKKQLIGFLNKRKMVSVLKRARKL